MFRQFTCACLAPAALLAAVLGQAVAQTPMPPPVPRPICREAPSPFCVSASECSVSECDEVSVEILLVSVPPSLVEGLLADGSPISLDDAKAKAVLEAIQGNARTSVLQAPKLTVASGQRATCRVAELQQFVTGVEITARGGMQFTIPKFEKIATGVKLSVRPTVSADRRFVRLAVRAELKSVDDSTPPFPVVIVVQPTGRPKGNPVVFTQFVQQPKARTITMDETFTAPVGRTVVFDAGTRTHAVRETTKMPVLGDVPFLQCLFTKESTRQEEEHVLVLVTPRILSLVNKHW
jgi:type II secretory pathway component GspD/PulD (secretin)